MNAPPGNAGISNSKRRRVTPAPEGKSAELALARAKLKFVVAYALP